MPAELRGTGVYLEDVLINKVMENKRFETLLLALLVTVGLWANGDPTMNYCALMLSKTPVSRHIPEVQIVDEHIDFELLDRYTHVHVTYTLKNNSSKKFRNIAYGFPVDWKGEGGLHWKEDYIFERAAQKGWSDDYVRNFSMKINGKRLKSRCSGDTLLKKGKTIGEVRPMFNKMTKAEKDSFEFYNEILYYMLTDYYLPDTCYYEEPVYRKWYYSYFSINAHETVKLEVDYTIQNNYRINMYEVNYEFVKFLSSTFGVYQDVDVWNYVQYDFIPAAAWGDGRADRLSFSINAKYKVEYPSYELTDNKYYAENFDFASAKELTLSYRCDMSAMRDDAKALQEHRLPANGYTIKVNGKEGDYRALCDNNLRTSMTLPADEKGMVNIEITTVKPEFVTGLALAHGDWRNRNIYRKSAKADSIMIICNYNDREEGSPKFCHGREIRINNWTYEWGITENIVNEPDFSSKKSLLLSMQRFNVFDRAPGIFYSYNDPWHSDDYTKGFTIQLHAPDGKGVSLSEIILTEDTKGWSDYFWIGYDDTENMRVIREFYREYHAAFMKGENTDSVVAKYGSEELIRQLKMVCTEYNDRSDGKVGFEVDPFFNRLYPDGFSADDIEITTPGRGEYEISGSEIAGKVVLSMNKEHEIVRILSPIYCY